MTNKVNSTPLPKRLKAARKAASMSQESLGIAAGLDEGTASPRMSQYETSVHTPDFSFIRNVARVLNISTAYFYCEEDDLAQIILDYKK